MYESDTAVPSMILDPLTHKPTRHLSCNSISTATPHTDSLDTHTTVSCTQ